MSAPAITRELTLAPAHPALSRLDVLLRLCEKIDAVLERRFWRWGITLSVVFVASAIVADVQKPMWTDELVTVHLAHQASVAEILKATMDHADLSPPLYSILAHALLPVLRNDALSVRLPSTLGYGGMMLCLMAFCRRRLPASYAIAAALLASYACREYATEGRGYGIMLACAAGALLCWQFATEGRHRKLAIPLFALCLAVGSALHYYSVFLLAPFTIAEIVRWHADGKPDISVLAAMAPALLVLAVHYPIIAATASFSTHHWSPAGLRRIPEFYDNYFLPMLSACVLPIAVMAILSPHSACKTAAPALTLPEWTALVALAAVPTCIVVLTKYTTHVFVSRYLLWAVPAMAVLTVALLCRAARARAAVGVSLLGLLLVFTGMTISNYLLTIRERPPLKEGERVIHALASLSQTAEPIVVADPHVFLELAYYAPATVRTRLICLNSRELELRYYAKDSAWVFLSGLSRHANLRIAPYEVLMAQPRFVLAALNSNPLPWELVKQGYRVHPIGTAVSPVVFEVEAPQPSR